MAAGLAFGWHALWKANDLQQTGSKGFVHPCPAYVFDDGCVRPSAAQLMIVIVTDRLRSLEMREHPTTSKPNWRAAKQLQRAEISLRLGLPTGGWLARFRPLPARPPRSGQAQCWPSYRRPGGELFLQSHRNRPTRTVDLSNANGSLPRSAALADIGKHNSCGFSVFYSAAPRSARLFKVTRFFCPGQAIGLLVAMAGSDFHDEDGPLQEDQVAEDVIPFDIAPAEGHGRSPIPSATSSCGRWVLWKPCGRSKESWTCRCPATGALARSCSRKFRPRWVESI